MMGSSELASDTQLTLTVPPYAPPDTGPGPGGPDATCAPAAPLLPVPPVLYDLALHAATPAAARPAPAAPRNWRRLSRAATGSFLSNRSPLVPMLTSGCCCRY